MASAVAATGSGPGPSAPRKRADGRRNEETLLDAAAAAFVTSGVDVPVRDIAGQEGVGVGTIYRHFPTRADLIVAVYRHQVEACAGQATVLLANSSTPRAALATSINLFVNFLVTKHGLARALQSDKAAFETLHAYFLDRLVPVCAPSCSAPPAAAGEILPGIADAYELMLRRRQSLIGADNNPRYDARRMARKLLMAGLPVPVTGGRSARPRCPPLTGAASRGRRFARPTSSAP